MGNRVDLKYSAIVEGAEFFFPNKKEFRIIYKEIFVDEIYKPRISISPDLIIDGGGYIGLSAMYFALNFPESKVQTYEPNPKAFQYLKQNTGYWNNISVHQKALGNLKHLQVDEQWMSVAGVQKGSWTTELNTKSLEIDNQNIIEILKPNTYLKLDIEGSEFNLINSLSDSDVKKIAYLVAEIHPIKNKNSKDLLDQIENQWNFNIEVEEADDGLITLHGWPKSKQE